METRAYAAFYLPDAKRHLGACTDYLVRVCGLPADRVGVIYATSGTMAMFGRGDPGVLAGLSGTELGQRLFRELRGGDEAPSPVPSGPVRSPEYLLGRLGARALPVALVHHVPLDFCADHDDRPPFEIRRLPRDGRLALP